MARTDTERLDYWISRVNNGELLAGDDDRGWSWCVSEGRGIPLISNRQMRFARWSFPTAREAIDAAMDAEEEPDHAA